MNSCLELHYPDDLLERYAMGQLSALDYVPLEEHLLICTACQNNLLAVEDYILVARAALAAPKPPLASAYNPCSVWESPPQCIDPDAVACVLNALKLA